MKKSRLLTTALLALAMSLAFVLPAGASDTGFTVDCTGAFGFGDVPAHTTYTWFVRFFDPGKNSGTGFVTDQLWQDNVYGGDNGAAFNPQVLWPITPSQGATSDDSYYWVDIWNYGTGVHVYHAEGHFDCPPPPPPPPPPGGEGCTPGFWQGRNNGRLLWDELLDPNFNPADGNPFATFTVFNDFFTPVGSLNGLTMLDLVGTGGGPDAARKAARDLVAAYLNASHANVDYPFTTTELTNMWNDAVANGTFAGVHSQLDAANNLGCEVNN